MQGCKQYSVLSPEQRKQYSVLSPEQCKVGNAQRSTEDMDWHCSLSERLASAVTMKELELIQRVAWDIVDPVCPFCSKNFTKKWNRNQHLSSNACRKIKRAIRRLDYNGEMLGEGKDKLKLPVTLGTPVKLEVPEIPQVYLKYQVPEINLHVNNGIRPTGDSPREPLIASAPLPASKE
jgi:hypothetical protein